MQKIATIILLAFSYSCAQAQEALYQFNSSTMRNSIKCELGSYSSHIPWKKMKPERLKVKVTLKGKEETTVGGGLGVKFPILDFDIGGELKQKLTKSEKYVSVHNIHPDNIVNCKKKNRIDIGIGECLENGRDYYVNDDGEIYCDRTVLATAKAHAGFKALIWLVGVGPNGEYDKTRTYEINTVLPSKSSDKKEE